MNKQCFVEYVNHKFTKNMLFYDGNIKITTDNSITINNPEELKPYIDTSNLTIKYVCEHGKMNRRHYIVLANNAILFILCNGSQKIGVLGGYIRINIIKLANIRPMFMEIHTFCQIPEYTYTDNGGVMSTGNYDDHDPSQYILSLYTINYDNKLTLTNISIEPGEILREYKITESTSMDLPNILHMEPLQSKQGFLLYTDNEILLINKYLKITYRTKYVQNLNAKQMKTNDYYYIYVDNNEIFVHDVITDKFLFSSKSDINIKSIVHTSSCVMFALDDKNNLYITS